MELRPVTPEDYPFLYDLLKEKTPEQNISHREMPTYEEHCAFNDQKPYAEDYVILCDGQRVGRAYLTKQREVGIHVTKDYQGQGVASWALDQLLAKGEPLLANIAPQNVHSQSFFAHKGFRLIQYTYRWEP